jgi:uncharacterized protein DUF1801
VRSKAKNVTDYLKSLPADRRKAISAVRDVIRKNLDKDYEEGMQYGMIGYYVPHRIFPDGYHCDPSKPLQFIALGSQKNHMALYLSGIYGSADEAKWFKAAWAKSGKKLDMGKSCVRFKKIEDLALDVLGEAVKRVPAKVYLKRYQDFRAAYKPTPRAEIATRANSKAAADGKG